MTTIPASKRIVVAFINFYLEIAMNMISEYETSSLMTGLYERFDPARSSDGRDYLDTLADQVRRAIRHWHNEYLIARTMAALTKLDADTLHDIGLSRDDIAAAARNSVENLDPDYPQAS
jgi:uncharacterized protein YjiS (DUF1127 family)